MNEITYTKRFRKAIQKIYKSQYYVQKNFYDKIVEKIQIIKVFPTMYPKIGEKYRKIPISNYIILYKIQENTIYIINIISTKSSYYNQLY